MRVLMNFMLREVWHISFLADDARTPVGRRFTVHDMDSLLRVVVKLNGNDSRVKTAIYNWGRGSEWVELSPEQWRFFGITEDKLK